MPWLARSIANSLRIDDDVSSSEDDDDDNNRATTSAATTANSLHDRRGEPKKYADEDQDLLNNQGRGVKEDLSEFRETLTRQLWGVASFLAPPPQPDSNPADKTDAIEVFDRNRFDSSVRCASANDFDENDAGSVGDSGVEDGFAYTHDRLKSEISVHSSFLPFRTDDEIAGAVGVTDEVLTFAGNIAHHPETWLDFPVEEEEMDDFEMSEAQCKHAMAVERLTRRLAALRIELCPAHMSEGYFWKVYFVLLHSRLNKHDNELLSSPQIVAARAMWMQELQKRTKSEPDWLGRNTSYSTGSANSIHEDFEAASSDSPCGNTFLGQSHFPPTDYHPTEDFHSEKQPFVASDQIIDKSVIKEEKVLTTDKEIVASSSYKLPNRDYEDDDGDSWLEENPELEGYNGTAILFGTDEDVSFSDLEDNDDLSFSTKSKK